MDRLNRRAFVRALSAAAAGGLLGACSRGGAATPARSPTGAGSDTLSVVSASFEQLVGKDRPFAFGLFEQTASGSSPLHDGEVQLQVVPDDGEPQAPVPATFHEVQGNPAGVYLATVDLVVPGLTSFVATTARGRSGSAALHVVEPEHSELPAPGRSAPEVPTPTRGRQLGYAEICTRQPACSMHEISADEALRRERPVALTFATPAYCQTAICGPVVDIVEDVRSRGGWGDVAFVHCEIYADDGQTVGRPVQRWDLPSEPWLFTIDAGGRIAARADGPLLTLPDQVAALIEQARG